MVPVGAGASKKIPVEGLEPADADFLPGGKGFVINAQDKGGKAVLAVVGPEGGKPRILTTEGYVPNLNVIVSPDGERLAYGDKDGKIRILKVSDGQTSTVPFAILDQDDDLLTWTLDGRFLLLGHEAAMPLRVDRLEISTGRRAVWKNLMPEDPTGLIGVSRPSVSPDGETYAYSYLRNLVDDLYLVDGIR